MASVHICLRLENLVATIWSVLKSVIGSKGARIKDGVLKKDVIKSLRYCVHMIEILAACV